ncbi:MAG TPA: type IV pilin N-terminal domain-containing protein [Methanocorpusculum sp.]|nr:type IV pilin N-terminal domain-containing protein [Methanocorpusculum sp.]
MKERKEAAVSPVVGVMLMLVVTIIIAGVVAVFAGSMAGSTEAAPVISLETELVNGGNYYNSHFSMKVLSVSEPIPTSDLKITTTWYDKTNAKWVTTSTGDISTSWSWQDQKPTPGTHTVTGTSPYGYGSGVAEVNTGVPNNEQGFGSYTLVGGTSMQAYPAGQAHGYIDKNDKASEGYFDGSYTGFAEGSGSADAMQSIFGYGWENLKSGDTVNVKLIYLPSGTAIYEKDVVVS